jgi:hypothetical protein
MKKRTHFEFEGPTGYTYVSKKYGDSRIGFEVHIRHSEESTDVLHFVVDASNGRSMCRSLCRAIVESDPELGLDTIQGIVEEFKEKLEAVQDSEE